MKCKECGTEYDEELDDCCPACGAAAEDEIECPDETRSNMKDENRKVNYSRKELEDFMEEEDNYPW